eukprot:4326137-Ditylum_brightwellii.AAC.1
MARVKRRAVGRSCFQQCKKSRTADHIGDNDSMDVNHSDMGENFPEELEQSKADETDNNDDNSNKQGKEGKEEKKNKNYKKE